MVDVIARDELRTEIENGAVVVVDALPAAPGLADRLTDRGYSNVKLYRDGIQDWAGAGYPLESGRSAG